MMIAEERGIIILFFFFFVYFFSFFNFTELLLGEHNAFVGVLEPLDGLLLVESV